MKIILVTTVLPHGKSTGGEIATENFIAGLKDSGHQVHVLGYERHGGASVAPPGYLSAGRRYIESRSSGWRAALWYCLAYIFKRPYVVQKFISPGMVRSFRSLQKQTDYDLLIIDHIQISWLLAYKQKDLPYVLIAHNFESRLYGDQATKFPAKSLKRYIYEREADLLGELESVVSAGAAQVWTLTSEEQEQFLRLSKGVRVALFGLPGYANARDQQDPTKYDVCLLGTWEWEINRIGLDWFLNEVVPLLPSEVSIAIAGRGSESMSVPPNVVGLGLVESARKFLSSGRIIAIPTMSGAGVQLKTIEAIASGYQTVSTPLAIRGIKEVPAYLTVAESAEAFAEAILEQIRSYRKGAYIKDGSEWFEQRKRRFAEALNSAVTAVRADR